MYTERCSEKLKAMGAPLVGWCCEDVIDWGEATFTCELCGYKNVRFVHVMVHKDFSGKLRVGCICAGNLMLRQRLQQKNRWEVQAMGLQHKRAER